MIKLRRATCVLAVLTLGALVTACSSTGANPGTQTGFVAGDSRSTFVEVADREPAPDLSGELLGGGTYDLAEERGDDIVVINVWGSWCGPCMAEADALEAAYQEVKDQGVQFIGINTRDNEKAALGFVSDYDISYPSLVDEGGALQVGFADSLPIAAIPTTLIIDRDGRVAARTLSAVTYDSMLALLEPVLAESTASAARS